MTNDDLTTIPGVGPTIAANLRDAGFETCADVLESTVDELTEADRIGESSAEAIISGEMSGYNGRPKELNDKREAILEAAERGLTYEGIARVAGVGVQTLRDWRNDHPEFSEELEQRRAIGEMDLVERVAEDRPEFILERSYDYIKTERREVEGEHEHEHTIEGDGFTVEFDDED